MPITKNVVDARSAAPEALEIVRDLAELKLAPTPEHYQLWYHYHQKLTPGLVKELNELLERKIPLTEAIFGQLYEKYFEAEGVNQANVTQAMNELLGVVSRFRTKNENYNTKLQEHTDDLSAKMEGDEDLQHMLGAVVEQIKEIQQSGDDFGNQLIESQKEISQLKQNLNKATHEARHDVLTGLLNRRAFDDLMQEMTAEADKEHMDLCLLMMDIDHFKQFNDNWGHQIGDEVLKVVASAVRRTVRGKDVVCRYGGEEFVVLLPETPTNGAHIVAENIRKLIANNRLKRRNSTEELGQITLSIGVTRYRCGDPKETIENFLQRADEALYSAKQHGRNRVSLEL